MDKSFETQTRFSTVLELHLKAGFVSVSGQPLGTWGKWLGEGDIREDNRIFKEIVSDKLRLKRSDKNRSKS
jgi:hypothetical protein